MQAMLGPFQRRCQRESLLVTRDRFVAGRLTVIEPLRPSCDVTGDVPGLSPVD